MKRPRELVRPLSVLVVDGYPDAATSLALVLTTEGFAARIALCGGEAAAAAAAEPPDVVVFEPRTPGGGWELLRRLAEPVAGKRPFLVALTTDTTAVGREAADALGAGLYLIKPENPAVLVRALRRLGQAVNESVPGAAEPIARRGAGGADPRHPPRGIGLAAVRGVPIPDGGYRNAVNPRRTGGRAVANASLRLG